ncbi:hypothetical protein FPQ10_09470 [Allobacillus sp. SKP2-8]|uniref:DUF5677 domain-containing protein n=1 Tax=unclassified Allobacillus TaxID=2628859 RepID=UPI001182E60D|nr:DUF5677 domain-containing protein [Allobacillus sp. SKP2-8]TSJ65618.1 hypothetical protein FPQ10_09470 [Allobacillus sp. SKP2-8]
MADKTSEFLQDTFMELFEKQLEEAKTQEEANEIAKKFNELDLARIFEDMYMRMVNDTTRFMRDSMHEQVMTFRAKEQEFLSIQEQKWSKAFVASESMYIMVAEAAESYVEHVNEIPQDVLETSHYTFTAMLHIHGRSLQQFLEIITLMKNGFADGAFARWRSLYELTIVSSFITLHGERVAREYIESSKTDDRYEWAKASGIFSNINRYITFNDLQKNCEINSEVWRRQYDLANKIVHASPQGTFARLSNAETENIIPIGRSDFGITTAAEHSAISLAQITAMFFNIHLSGDNVVAMRYINNWIDVIREIYFKTHDSIFPDHEKLWNDNMVSYEDELEGE